MSDDWRGRGIGVDVATGLSLPTAIPYFRISQADLFNTLNKGQSMLIVYLLLFYLLRLMGALKPPVPLSPRPVLNG